MGRTRFRRFPERTLSLACFIGVLAVLLHWDPRVRDRLSTMAQNVSQSAGSHLSDGASTIGGALIEAVLHQSISHAPLLIFGVVAAVLVICMLRT